MASNANYPPPPWRMLGQCWAGLFRADQPPALPAGLRPVLPRRVVLGLVRYREGTLRYDELFTAALARRGLRAGLFVHDIWVDNAASQAGNHCSSASRCGHAWAAPPCTSTSGPRAFPIAWLRARC